MLPTAASSERTVLELLDVKQGKSDSTKEKVYIVKQNKAKYIGIAFCLLVLVGVGFVFNSSYDLQIARRELVTEHRIHDVTDAVEKKKMTDIIKELQSHLVSEIKERDDTMKQKNLTMEKVSETLTENKGVLNNLFNKLDDSFDNALQTLPAKLEKLRTEDPAAWGDPAKRGAAVERLLAEAKGEVSAELSSTREVLKTSLDPIKEQVKKSFETIVKSEVARGEAASDHLQHVNGELVNGELQVAEANAHLEQIMVEQQDKFTVDDQKDMLQNFFAHLSAELEQLDVKKEELIASGSADFLQHALTPVVRIQLQTILKTLRGNNNQWSMKGKKTTAHKQLRDLIQSGVIPPPADSDQASDAYILQLLQQDARMTASKLDCSAVATCNPRTPCKTTYNYCVELTGEQTCPSGSQMCTNFAGTGDRSPLLWENTQRRKDLTQLQSVEAQWNDGKLDTERVWRNIVGRVQKKAVPGSWLTMPSKPTRPANVIGAAQGGPGKGKRGKAGKGGSNKLSDENKKWMKESFAALHAGTITEDNFYSDIMTKYNEGQIGYETMSRLTRRFSKGKAHGDRATDPFGTRGKAHGKREREPRPPPGKARGKA